MTNSAELKQGRRKLFFSLLLLATTGLAFLALVIPIYAPTASPALQVGQVAPQEIRAPHAITYQSEVLTQQQRDAVARAVPSIFTSPDPTIARQQLEKLRTSLAYVTNVRADTYASQEQKLSDLSALEDIHLSQDTANSILALSDARWQTVQQESIVVLEQVMRSTIREDHLDEARRNVPALVSLSLPEDQTMIVADIVSAFVTPNSLYSETLTEAARQKASESVAPVTRSYKAGETIIQSGQVITATDLEALQQLGLVQPQYTWKDVIGAATLVILLIAFSVFYLRHNRKLVQDARGLALMALLFLIFLFGARLLGSGHTLIPYIYPIPAYSLIIAVLFGAEPALVSSLPLAILAAYGYSNALDLTLFYTLSGFFGVLTLGRARRITSFFWAGAAIASAGAIVIIAYRLPQPNTDWIGIASLAGIAFINGAASASLSILLQFFLAQFLGMTTALQLMEISRPDHPLLQLILRNASGTYQHSLQVANLAEQAAEQIGADTLLTRVGALYHDVGKALNPFYFIENQVPGNVNPHDDLDPVTSSQTIIKHVTDGLELARTHRLPRRIQDFILEHHGTMVTRYQYVNAVKAADGDESQVDIEQFRYPGPAPQSRETAILMLADGCEARMRAERPKDEEELRQLIKEVVDNRTKTGQLDGTDLTLHDLDAIVDSFTATLRGIYHPRIEYPKLEKAPAVEDPPADKTVPVRAPANSSLPSPAEPPPQAQETAS